MSNGVLILDRHSSSQFSFSFVEDIEYLSGHLRKNVRRNGFCFFVKS